MIVYSLLTRTNIDIKETIFSDLVTRLTDTPEKSYMAYLRLLSTSIKESTRKSKPFLEGKPIDPQDSERNKKLADMGFPAIIGFDHLASGSKYQTSMMKSYVGEDMEIDKPKEIEESSQPSPQTDEELHTTEHHSPPPESSKPEHKEGAAAYADLHAKVKDFTNESLYTTAQTEIALNNGENPSSSIFQILFQANLEQNERQLVIYREAPSWPEGEPKEIVTREEVQDPHITLVSVTPITTISSVPTLIISEVIRTTTVVEVLVNESSSTPKVTDSAPKVTPPKLAVPKTQVGNLICMDIAKITRKEPKTRQKRKRKDSSFTIPKIDKGRGIAKETNDSPPKLTKALRTLHPDQDAPVMIDYEIDGQIVKLTGDQLGEILDKKEKMEKAALNAEDFLKHHDAHLKVYNDKLRKKAKLKKKMYDDYVWIMNNRRKRGKITNIHIYPRSNPISVKIYRNNNKRDFEVYKVFRFGDLNLSEWDELGAILLTKTNKCVPNMLNTLSKKCEILKEIAKTLKIDEKLPLPEQDPSLPSNKKIKAMELEPETYIAGMDCNGSLLEGVTFVNTKAIEELKDGMFFIDVFGDKSFQRVGDIHKIDTETLFGYKMMAFNDKTVLN
uniref:Retrovirus-related Pol polyprotein from transposon TNT 1-94 n=1 Tax=Tanacetum cinerariifolium TaxID=118510 RepID=A0A699GIH4_TANCI|nr:hypothetical protein [Tanacetum cinerariifolium]